MIRFVIEVQGGHSNQFNILESVDLTFTSPERGTSSEVASLFSLTDSVKANDSSLSLVSPEDLSFCLSVTSLLTPTVFSPHLCVRRDYCQIISGEGMGMGDMLFILLEKQKGMLDFSECDLGNSR